MTYTDMPYLAMGHIDDDHNVDDDVHNHYDIDDDHNVDDDVHSDYDIDDDQ